jgi:hypothetical protein
VLIISNLATSGFARPRRARTRIALAILALTIVAPSAFAAGGPKKYAKLDSELNERAGNALSQGATASSCVKG